LASAAESPLFGQHRRRVAEPDHYARIVDRLDAHGFSVPCELMIFA
jgi:hypothetical protein